MHLLADRSSCAEAKLSHFEVKSSLKGYVRRVTWAPYKSTCLQSYPETASSLRSRTRPNLRRTRAPTRAFSAGA